MFPLQNTFDNLWTR